MNKFVTQKQSTVGWTTRKGKTKEKTTYLHPFFVFFELHKSSRQCTRATPYGTEF